MCESSVRAATATSATLRVVDQGEGFPADFRDRAFEPFTRADPARDLGTGTAGLGLSIARGIVTAHGGTIGLADPSMIGPIGLLAVVDGEPAEIHRANGLFRAVAVPEGTHTVEFTYRSFPLMVGGAVSLVSLIGVAVFLVYHARSRRGSAPRMSR